MAKKFIREIDRFLKSDKNQIQLNTQQLVPKQRSQVHKYAGKVGLHCESKKEPDFSGPKDCGKVMIITKGIGTVSIYTDVHAGMFVNLTNLPIRCKSIKVIGEHVKKLDPFFPGSLKLFNMFMEETKEYDVYQEVKRVVEEVGTYIRNHEEIKKIMKEDPLKGWKSDVDKKLRRPIYEMKNAGKKFLSFDVKQGNFTTIKRLCPTLFPGSWEEFIGKFTESEFAKHTKNRRSYIFVNAGLHGLCVRLCEYELDCLEKFLSKTNLDLTDPVLKTNDEIIFELSDVSEELIKDINRIINGYEKKDMFRMEIFTLRQIPETKGFLRDGIDGKRQIKCIQPKHMMKAIDIINSVM